MYNSNPKTTIENVIGLQLALSAVSEEQRNYRKIQEKRENVFQFAKSLSAMNTVYQLLNVFIALNKYK